MADLIERYKITANLPSVMMNYCNRFNSKQIELITEMIYELENNIESVDVQPNRWISVEERLPQDNKNVLVYMRYSGISLASYVPFLQTWVDSESCGLDVTHWRPLPEPPKEG